MIFDIMVLPFEKLGIKLADQFIASSIGMKNYLMNKEPQNDSTVVIEPK